MKEMSQVLLFADFILEIGRKISYLFRVRLRRKDSFRVLVDVHEMAKTRKVLCKQYASIEKY